MGLRFTMLASGSGGNACLVQCGDGDPGVLIDAGLGPRQIGARLRAVGLSWAAVKAVLLTHTHSDHWKERTLAFLHRGRVPLYCHPAHHAVLLSYSLTFQHLLAAGLVRAYESGRELAPVPGLRCRPLPVRHDSGATFGFRVEGKADLFGRAAALGYVADLGTWDEPLADALADTDLLAVEFNHDVGLERASGRSARLIARVLGDEGHLSNDQAAALVRAVLRRSPPGRLGHLVQLHLSHECNRRALARQAGQAVLDEMAPAARLHTAHQDHPAPPLRLEPAPLPRGKGARPRRAPAVVHPWLPGLAPVETEAPQGDALGG
jgi:phosphoribosyl 1,2-cyclic phosphodiesterase